MELLKLPYMTLKLGIYSLFFCLSFIVFSPLYGYAADELYWCPKRPADQKYSMTPAPDCIPFVDEEKDEEKKTGKKRDPIKLDEIQTQASIFLREYREFLGCCAANVNSLNRVDELKDYSSAILKSIQEERLINMGSPDGGTNWRQFTISEIVRPVAKARDDLRTIGKRLEEIAKLQKQIETLDYESAGRAERRIQELTESISTEFHPNRPAGGPPTGVEIGDTTLPSRMGTKAQDTTLPTAFGADIGQVASPDNAKQSTLNPRVGPATQSTNLPTSTGSSIAGSNLPASDLPTSTGFGIGSTGRVGPGIGDSSLNQPSR